jgi:hypothetical protein
LLETVRATGTPDDLINFVYTDALTGAIHASEGRFHEAESSGRRALERAEATDYFFMRSWVRLLLADTLRRSGRDGDARTLASEGLAILDAKGDLTGAARYRDRLDRLGVALDA